MDEVSKIYRRVKEEMGTLGKAGVPSMEFGEREEKCGPNGDTQDIYREIRKP